MDGTMTEGWYRHPQLGLIRVLTNSNQEWVYICYSDSGSRVLSKEKPLDSWTWALCETENR